MKEKQYKLVLEDGNGSQIETSVIAEFQYKNRDFLVLNLSNQDQEEAEIEFIIMELKDNHIVHVESEEEYIELCNIFENNIWQKIKHKYIYI